MRRQQEREEALVSNLAVFPSAGSMSEVTMSRVSWWACRHARRGGPTSRLVRIGPANRSVQAQTELCGQDGCGSSLARAISAPLRAGRGST